MRFFLLSICSISLFCAGLSAQKNDTIISKKLSEVKVTASSKPSITQSTTPLQVLTEEELQKQGILSVADAAKRFGGIVLKDYGGIGGLKTVSIRGMGTEYTSVSYDGIMVSNLQSGQVDIGRFTLDNISMLSLSIGQADDIFLTAQSFSAAGTLNLQTKRPAFNHKKYLVHTRITAGAFGHFEPMLNFAYKISNKTSLTANVNWQRADGMYAFRQEDDVIHTKRKRKNSDTDILRTELNLYNVLSTTSYLDFKLYYFDSQRGLPGGVIIGSTMDDRKQGLGDKNAFMQMAYNKNLGEKWKYKSQLKYDYYHTRYKEAVNDGIDQLDKHHQHEGYWSNALLHSILPSLSASVAQDFGYNYLKSHFAREGLTKASNPKRFNSFTALALKYQISQLTISGNLLYTYVHQETDTRAKKDIYRKISPSFSISYQPLQATNWRLRASYKHIYRIPTLNELFYVSTFKSLDSESSSQYNVGTTWVGSIDKTPFQYITASVDAYYNVVSDKIIIFPGEYVPTSLNMGEVKMKGVDAKLATNIKIYNKINIDISGVYSYLNAYDDDKRNESTYKHQLPYTPKHSGSASLSINNPLVNISYSILFSDKRYSSVENLDRYKLKPYNEHSISLFKELRIKETTLYANGTITNLWNKNYNIIAFYPMPGRAYKISVGYKF